MRAEDAFSVDEERSAWGSIGPGPAIRYFWYILPGYIVKEQRPQERHDACLLKCFDVLWWLRTKERDGVDID